jgi:hypothetical protein
MNPIETDQIQLVLFSNQKDEDSKKELINLGVESEELFDVSWGFSGIRGGLKGVD